MKVLGLDLGNKTLGVAISDELGFLARGVETFRFEEKDFDAPCTYVIDFCNNNKIGTIVLGFPKNMDGTVGEQGKIVLAFKEQLESSLSIPVVLWDERLTSKMASSMMISQNLKRKKRQQDIDKMAAIIILQGYLDKK